MRRERAAAASGLLLLGVIGACAPPSTSTPAAPTALHARDARIGLTDADAFALAAVLAAADARRPDTNAIDDALRSRNTVVRASAARAIGQIGITARATSARALVADADSAVAADAAFALGAIRDTTAIAVLAGALAGPSTVQAAAAWSLGEMGQPARAAMEVVLRSSQRNAALPAVLEASVKLRPVPVALIVPHLQSPELAVRRSAAYAVTRAPQPMAVRSLLAVVSAEAASPRRVATIPDTAADLRSYVARGLLKSAAGDSLAADALAALRRLAADAHPHVRITALRSLATYGPVVRAEITAHVRDPDANVRVAIAQTVGDVFGNDRAAWMAAWVADTGLTYRRSLLGPALRNGVRLPAVEPNGPESWLRHRDWAFRAALAQAVAGAAPMDIDAVAVPLLEDPDGRVRSVAYAVVAPWADSAAAAAKPYGRSSLARAIGDKDVYVRTTILTALQARARARDVALALEAWHNAAGDVENDARVAALRLIAAAWRADSTAFVPSLRDSITAVGAPAGEAELAVGRSIPLLRHWPAPQRPERARAWYIAQVREFVDPDVTTRPRLATIATTRGDVRIRLYGADAPLTVANFVGLARRGYFNGSVFHRVVPNFVAQDGDPRGDGRGGPGYAIRDELNRRRYERGAVGMALSGPDTGGSQYFITHSPQPHLDGHYTVFGHVIDGFAALDEIVQGDRILTITIQ